jgi:hypothetical protein
MSPSGSHERGKAPDSIAGVEPDHLVTDLFDPAGELVAHHVRRLDPRPARVGPIAGIDGVDTSRPNSNDDVPWPGGWFRQLSQLEILSRPGVGDDDGAHAAYPVGLAMSMKLTVSG